MSARRHRGWLLAALLLLAGLALWTHVQRERTVEYGETLYVFGTLVEIVILGEEPAVARRAVAAIARDFQRIHDDWHAWRPGELARLNAAIASGETMVVSAALARVLGRAQALAAASGGLFEPAIGGIVRAWGFHADTLPSGPPPSAAVIARWAEARPAMADLRIDGRRVGSRNRAVRIDLGAFAKGVALDLAMARLRAMGIRDAVLNAGGSVHVLGTHGERPWRVAIRDPFGWGIVAGLELGPGEALHSSGNYERYLAHDGERFSHIIDPRTGRPVAEIVSASVLASDGALADAAATALSVAGLEAWREVADRMGVTAALLIDAAGRLHATPAMRARLALEPERSPDVVDTTMAGRAGSR